MQVDKKTTRMTEKVISYMEDSHRERPDQPIGMYICFFYKCPQSAGDSKTMFWSGQGSRTVRWQHHWNDLKLTSDALVYFASDHGCLASKNNKGCSNGVFKGGKGIWVLEGGIRVPGIIRWPGVVKDGSVIETPLLWWTGYQLLLIFCGVIKTIKWV